MRLGGIGATLEGIGAGAGGMGNGGLSRGLVGPGGTSGLSSESPTTAGSTNAAEEIRGEVSGRIEGAIGVTADGETETMTVAGAGATAGVKGPGGGEETKGATGAGMTGRDAAGDG
jgi:hypothetical protein